MKKPTIAAVSALVALFLTGCACTDVGCLNGLRVHLNGEPDEAYTVTATASGETRTITCGPDRPPCDSLFFEDFVPSTVTIEYRSEHRMVSRRFEPSYDRVRPNGLLCPPTCEQGEVTLDLR